MNDEEEGISIIGETRQSARFHHHLIDAVFKCTTLQEEDRQSLLLFTP